MICPKPRKQAYEYPPLRKRELKRSAASFTAALIASITLAAWTSAQESREPASRISILEEGRNYCVVQHTIEAINPQTGLIETAASQYVELASGLNYQDPAGAWLQTQELFEPLPDGGYAAERGPHKLRLAPNLNALHSIELRTEDGLVLRSSPVAVGYFDPVSGKSVVLAQVQDARPRQLSDNEIVYENALDDLAGAFRYTYRRNGMSQDLILLEAPPDPELLGLSAETRLEVYTQWADNLPEPVRAAQPIYIEPDPAVRAAKAEPDFPRRGQTIYSFVSFYPGLPLPACPSSCIARCKRALAVFEVPR
jgi:hypothetical protein